MAIDVRCPHCGKELQARDQFAGQKLPCPECGEIVLIQGESNPYAAPRASGPSPDARTSGAAIASLVLGLMSLVFTILTGIPAIILGIIAQGSISKSGGHKKGTGLATAGIVTGSIGTIMLPCLGVLIALLLPAVQSAREAARRSQCTNNLKQISLALYNYNERYGSFPPAYTTDAQGKPLLSWRVLILPYLEQSNLYEQFKLDEPWDGPTNLTLFSRMPSVYKCPSEPGGVEDSSTPYQVLVGPGTIFEPGQVTRIADITDGTSNTLLVGEATMLVGWTIPSDTAYSPGVPPRLGSFHPGGYNAAMADGSVRFIKKTVGPPTTDAIAVKDDRKPTGDF